MIGKQKLSFIHFKKMLNATIDRLAVLPKEQQYRAIYFFFLGYAHHTANAKIVAQTNEVHFFFGRHYSVITETETKIF